MTYRVGVEMIIRCVFGGDPEHRPAVATTTTDSICGAEAGHPPLDAGAVHVRQEQFAPVVPVTPKDLRSSFSTVACPVPTGPCQSFPPERHLNPSR